MTAAQIEQALAKLCRRLGLESPEEDTLLLLEDELNDAACEVLLYLGADNLEECWLGKVTELAALYYQRDRRELEGGGLQSASYTEGQVSQSEQYLTPSAFQAGVAEILDSLARYRRVSC